MKEAHYTRDRNMFHGRRDREITYWPGRYRPRGWIETKETKYFVVQERDVSYRLYQHVHPHVGPLVQKLLRQSVRGLQAADTEYAADGKSLPGSLEITTGAAALTLAAGTRIALVANVQGTLPNGTPIQLASTMEVKCSAATTATATDGVHASLVDGMINTPTAGTAMTVAQGKSALLFGDTRVTLTAATGIILLDGTTATLPAGTQAIVARTVVTFAAATQATLHKAARLPVLYQEILTASAYTPTALVQRPYPVRDLDFTSSGAYAVYNWELFFHVPITVGIHLSKNNRFAEAQRWFHFLFDPTDDSDGPTPERFWKVRPFQSTDVKKVEEILVNLVTGADETLRKETVRSIEAWKDAPFRPHVIARYRQQAYMYKTVMAYLDNLIAWGDSLFRQDTGEAIDEALMLYVLAANILGPRPQAVPPKGTVRPQTYDNLRKDLRQFGTAVRDVEADVPFDLMPFPTEGGAETERLATLRSLGKALYFGVPRNDKLLSYWDTVADRLFKIHNSLNLQGIFRQLALFEPPIDPALLARAAAAGVDIAAVVSGLNQPLPLVRFQLLAQRATEIVQEVKSLGNNLLQAMEKEDNEALAALRARHERTVMELVEQVKYSQLQEAIKAREALSKSMSLAIERYAYYERLLGRERDQIEKSIPQIDDLDTASLEKMKFAMKEADLMLRDINVDIAENLDEAGGRLVTTHEAEEMDKLKEAQDKQDSAGALERIGSYLAIIPTFGAHVQPLGPGGSASFGGGNLAAAMTAISSYDRSDAGKKTYEAGKTSKIGGYARREQEWAFQSVIAASEINHTLRQLRAAQLREAIAEQELRSHRTQIEHAKDIEAFLNADGAQKNGKNTNKTLYAWIKREVRGLYAQSFQLAFDTARKAERALQHELGRPDLTYLQFGYLSGKEGLLAGEKLHLDIKRMEMAYHDLNQREYEMTKHVSLLQVAPLALVALRTTGQCTVALPESLFDMDGPGHYFRRMKSVAVSVPSVGGPYTSVNCRLTLLKSGIRKSPVLRDGAYARDGAEDDRFDDFFGSLQSIVTSSAQNDSGLFETSVRDERYLPFENSGVISEWRLQLPANPSKGEPTQFDFDTIADVILHIRYTGREGGDLLRKGAIDNMRALADAGAAVGATRLFSVRQEFPTEWAKFQGSPADPAKRFGLAINLREEHYPFWSQNKLNAVVGIQLLARSGKAPAAVTLEVFEVAEKAAPAPKKDTLSKDASLGNLLVGRFTGGAAGLPLPAKPVGELKLFYDDRALDDLWLALQWSGT